MDPQTPLTEFPAVGPARAKGLARLGLTCAGDLLRYYPRAYEDRSVRSSIAQAPDDRPVCIAALVADFPRLSRIRKGLELVKVRAVDDTGTLDLTFFNQAYVKDSLHPGSTYIFYGTAEGSGSRRQMTNPVFEAEQAAKLTGVILPVYPLTAGISNNLLLGLTRRAVEGCRGKIPETLPEDLRQAEGLCSALFALDHIHFPADWESLAAARKRLSFEEFFFFSLGLELLRQRRTAQPGRVLPTPKTDFSALLPFSLTNAQRRTMAEIAADLASGRPMNRLLQGDVGSGKTVVAAHGAWIAAQNGAQSALMAPTEILAEQHFHTLSNLLSPTGMKLALLTGSTKGAQRKAVLDGLQRGEIDLVIGTHALLSRGVDFHDLALVITDEQHRFGVEQRGALAAKSGDSPHVLVMSATPIPRTLALIVYGDLEVSVLDELPPGRTPVETYLVGEDKRARMMGFVRKQVEEGRQAYIVCPMVEEGEETSAAAELKAATAYANDLQTRLFPDLRVGLIHGRMKAKEKEAVMSTFSAGQLDILVSTTVIEVGVDVPNASLIIIENAERFGLSQLHQLRGRVGRGQHQSYCVLVSGSRNPDTRARLKALCSTTDGFVIAEEDLKLRGPGDFFGSRQHGLPQINVAGFLDDIALLQQAQTAARTLLERDPGLERPEHQNLLTQVQKLFGRRPGGLN